MITSLDHIHIYADDPERTMRFYQESFAAEHLGALPTADSAENHFLLLGAQILVVSPFPAGMESATPPEVGEGAVRSGFGVAHFGLQTPDLDGLTEQLERRGVKVHGAPQGVGPIRYVYLSAPDGVVIELVELKLPPKLRPLRHVFEAYNRLIHVTKRAFASQLFRNAKH